MEEPSSAAWCLRAFSESGTPERLDVFECGTEMIRFDFEVGTSLQAQPEPFGGSSQVQDSNDRDQHLAGLPFPTGTLGPLLSSRARLRSKTRARRPVVPPIAPGPRSADERFTRGRRARGAPRGSRDRQQCDTSRAREVVALAPVDVEPEHDQTLSNGLERGHASDLECRVCLERRCKRNLHPDVGLGGHRSGVVVRTKPTPRPWVSDPPASPPRSAPGPLRRTAERRPHPQTGRQPERDATSSRLLDRWGIGTTYPLRNA